jgi:16S rRNA (uracil1498-N3)-methyltransferase
MRLHNFFIEQKIGEMKSVRVEDADLLHQLKNVFRLKKDDEIVLLDNSGFQYRCRIELLAKDEAVFEVLEVKENAIKPEREIYLYVSMIKKDNFEWVLEKGTEIGVSYFVPIISGRSIKTNFNHERGLKIVKEASEQSGRGTQPELREIISLNDALGEVEKNKMPAVAFHLEEGLTEAADFIANKLKKQSGASKVAIFIGPEGGWNDTEVEQFRKHGVNILSLGEATLRAETAAIVAATLFLL